MRWSWRRKERIEESDKPLLAFPYYVDSPGLRTLADSLGIDLPFERQRRREKAFRLEARGAGGETVAEQSATSEGHIHLNRLAVDLKRMSSGEVVDVLGHIPPISDRSILGAAIAQVKYMPPEEGSADDLAKLLEWAYGVERANAVAAAKLAELREIALQNQTVILRGMFEAVKPEAPSDRMRVRLTHLEEYKVPYEQSGNPAEATALDPAEIPMPEGVGIEAVLPAEDAFTPAGTERLNRGAPFYGCIIGHSLSFEHKGGVLTCSAYAVWGMRRPNKLRAEPEPYDFLEPS
jgi:hypothetical protein